MNVVVAKLGLIIMLYCVQQLGVDNSIASNMSLGKSLCVFASVRAYLCVCVFFLCVCGVCE